MFPTLIDWPIAISSFGVMVALGFIAGGHVLARGFEEGGYSRDDAWRVVFWCAIGGLLGAKLWYVAEQLGRGAPGDFLGFLLSRGGFTWYGGLVGGAAAGILAALTRGQSAVAVANASAPALALGQAVGRIGCLLVGDDYGRVTDVPWGIAFPQGLPPTVDPVHPTQIYEFAWLAVAAGLLWQRRGRSPFLIGEYLVLAGAGRLWIELFRTNPATLGPFTNAQLVALVCIAFGAVGWLRSRGRDLASAS